MKADAARTPPTPPPTREHEVVAALRAGDRRMFVALVKQHHRSLVRLAKSYVRRDDIAEEVAQEAWQGLIESLPRFEPHRATLKTWLFRILVNCARARSRKERRTAPLSSLVRDDDEEPSLPAARFLPEDHLWAGHWSSAPRRFVLDDPAASRQLRELLSELIASLPELQREVLVLRDVEGFLADDVCNTLGISDMNQRVLLHRARSKLRTWLEQRLGEAS